MRLITESSTKNLFWQFVGLGQANYGILEKLDDMTGRFIDNADFLLSTTSPRSAMKNCTIVSLLNFQTG